MTRLIQDMLEKAKACAAKRTGETQPVTVEIYSVPNNLVIEFKDYEVDDLGTVGKNFEAVFAYASKGYDTSTEELVDGSIVSCSSAAFKSEWYAELTKRAKEIAFKNAVRIK